MSKKTPLISIILVMTALLTGCFPNGDTADLKNSHQTSDIEPTSNIEQLDEKIENFVLDLTLPENMPKELPIIELSVHEWDIEKAVEIFLGDDEITEYYEFDSDFFEGEKYSVYQTEDAMFVIEKGRMSCRTNNRDKRSLCSYMDQVYEVQSYDTECTFATRKEAVEQVTKVLNELGVTNLSEPVVRGIDVPLANKLLEKSYPSGNYDPWDGGEFYYIRFSQVFEGIPIDAATIIREHGYYSTGSKITAIVDKNGIAEIDLFGIYSAEYKQNERVSVTSATNSLKTAVSHFEGQKLLSTYTMYDCKLVYTDIANKDNISYTFTPIWEFTYRHGSELPVVNDTGEEKIYYYHVDHLNRPVVEL